MAEVKNLIVNGVARVNGDLYYSSAMGNTITLSSLSSICANTGTIAHATISTSQALSFSTYPGSGASYHMVIGNSGSSTITVTLPTSGVVITSGESTISIGAGKYGEVNILTIGSTVFLRAIGS